jgi:hypothetical protein
MVSSTLWAQSSMFVVPLAHNKEVSIPMGKGFDTHVRNLLKKSTQVIDFESTQTAIKEVGCVPKCASKSAMVNVAKKVQPRFVLSGRMILEDEVYQINMTLFDAAYKKLYNLKKVCEFCDETEVKNKISALINAKSVQKILASTAPVIKEKIKSFTVELNSEPEGANISRAGKVMGKTPMMVELKPGTYEFKFSKTRFQTHTVKVQPPKDTSKPLKINHKLIYLMQDLAVDSIPQGAQVSIDGTMLKGKTPLKHKITIEKHSIKISLDGYQDFVKEIKARKKNKKGVKIKAQLQKMKDTVVVPTVIPPIVNNTPTPVGPVTPMSKPSFLNPTFSGTLLGLGTVAAGVGTWLVFLHGETACSGNQSRRTCPNIYDTRAVGYSSLFVGLVAASSGLTALLLNPRWPKTVPSKSSSSSKKTSQTIIAPLQEGAMIQWGTQF